MWQTALTLLRLRKPDPLCLVLGGDTFRYAVAGMEGPLQSEPATANRWRDTQRIGAIGEERPSCHRWTEREWVRLFEGEIEIDEQLLALFCAGMRRRMSSRGRCKTPMGLLVTGRPDLMARIAPLLPEAAAQSGFRSARVVAEHRCLAKAVDDDGPAALLVDIGHLGTRAYDWPGGQTTGPRAAGGLAMKEAICQVILVGHGLHIGQFNAERLFRDLDAPMKWPVQIKGRDSATQLPREAAIERDMVLEAVSPAFRAVAQTCEQALSASKAVSGCAHRLVLAGGCSHSQELRRTVEARLQLPAICLANPAEASLRGLCELVNEGIEG